MYEDLLDREEAVELVDELSKYSNYVIKQNYTIFEFADFKYKLPNRKEQLRFIERALDKNINVELVQLPVFLVENDNEKDVCMTVKSYAIQNESEIDIDDFKSLFILTWVDLYVDDEKKHSIIRYIGSEKEYKLRKR